MKRFITLFISLLLIILCVGAISSFNKPNNEKTNTIVDYSTMSMGCLGDSITRGVDGVNGGVMGNPYCSIVGDELGLLKTYNYGVNGATYTLNNLGRDSFVNNYKNMYYDLDIISVMGGVNDYDTTMPLGSIDDINGYTIYGSIKIVAKGLKELYPNSFVFFITPYNTTWNNNSTYELVDVVNAIKEVCSLYDIPVLDLYNNGDFEKEMFNPNSDGLHPSQNIIKNYTAPKIAKFIKDNYNK